MSLDGLFVLFLCSSEELICEGFVIFGMTGAEDDAVRVEIFSCGH